MGDGERVGRARAMTDAGFAGRAGAPLPPRSPVQRPARDPAVPPKLQLPPRGAPRARGPDEPQLSSSAPATGAFFHAAPLLADDGYDDATPTPHADQFAEGTPYADEGVFMLDDEDEEVMPEEDYGGEVDFGLTMEEYEPDDYVPSQRRDSHDGPLSLGAARSSPQRQATGMSDGDFLGSSFTGSPRLQSALQELHQQCRSRATTGSSHELRFGTSPPKA